MYLQVSVHWFPLPRRILKNKKVCTHRNIVYMVGTFKLLVDDAVKAAGKIKVLLRCIIAALASG